MVEILIIRLHGCRSSERLMRAVVVAEALEFGQLDVQGAHAQLAGLELVELVAAGGGGARAGAHAAKLRDRADGHGLLDAEAGLDGDALAIDLDHLAGLSPVGAVAPVPGVAVELAPPFGCWIVVKRHAT